MVNTPAEKFKIQEIIDGELITACYQPIVSLKRKSLIAFEGLTRGIDPQTKAPIAPLDLFSAASGAKVNLALDRLCRKKVLEQFKPIHDAHPEMMLNLNFDTSIIDQGVVGSGNLMKMVREAGLNPWNICIEIIESNVENTAQLKKFVDTYRNSGFLIALGGVGNGHSNLNRIHLLKPDILKIDRYFTQGINENFYKQQIFKSLVFMCRTLGTMIIAEGAETKAEALMVVQLGADVVQGFYFSKPMEPALCLKESYSDKILDLAQAFKNGEIMKISNKRIHSTKYHFMTREILTELSKTQAAQFDLKLEEIAVKFPTVECFYVLDDHGIQVSRTIFNDLKAVHQNRLMFRPAPKGADHTIKDYYYMLAESGDAKTEFITEPYLSMASGNMCVTISTFFNDASQKKHILCVDIKS
jgi:EAL domain-containing protein (putative c-di-GMP-specific phosphodiesterase class I)